MIRITIELVSAVTGRTSRLASCDIVNDGTGSPSKGNYIAYFLLKRNKIWRESRTSDFPRKYKNVWYLVQRLLNEALNDGKT